MFVLLCLWLEGLVLWYISAVYFTVTIQTKPVVNVDICLGIFLFSLSFQFRMQFLHCLHLQYTTTVVIYMLLKYNVLFLNIGRAGPRAAD